MNDICSSVLTAAETDELRALAVRWAQAHDASRFDESDRLRAELTEWGAWPPEQGWHPVSESPAHRSARIERRTAV